MPLPTHNDVPYLPDDACERAAARAAYPLWLTLAIFLGVFGVLQWVWGEARDTWVERLVIHEATVKPAAALIQLITPEANANPVAASIKAPGGGLNILNGCEGTEVMFLLVAAFAAVNLGWRHKLIGLALGLGLVFALNQARTFDKVGNILTKTTYQGSTTSYTYNAANRLTMLRNPDYTQVDYQYDPAGRLLSKVTANGARMTQQFDANGWQTRLTQYDAANAQVSDTSYTRDRLGNILTTVDAAGTTTYAYDPLYRLKTADYPGTANDELFTYDKAGNRKTATKGSLTANANTRYYNYTTGTNRLLDIRIGSAAGTVESSFTHDFEGRLTGQTGVGAKTLTWDAKGRVKTLGGETYSYDPMDYRIGRSGGSLGSLDYFLEGEHLESVYSGANLYAKYFRGSSVDELVAGYLYDTDSKLKPFLFHHDHNNSTTALSGHNGGTLQSTTFGAFGSTQSTTGTTPNRLKYTGREDDGMGLYYYRARYYDPAIGRFVSEDPLGFAAGDVNFFAYVSNNPVNANDPSGKLLSFTLNAFSRNPIPTQDATRISNFANTVALTGTSIAATPAISGLTGLGASGTSFAALSGSTTARTVATSGAIGGTTGVLSSWSTGGDFQDMAINGVVGTVTGVAFPFLPGTSALAQARNGAGLAGLGNFATQTTTIALNPNGSIVPALPEQGQYQHDAVSVCKVKLCRRLESGAIHVLS